MFCVPARLVRAESRFTLYSFSAAGVFSLSEFTGFYVTIPLAHEYLYKVGCQYKVSRPAGSFVERHLWDAEHKNLLHRPKVTAQISITPLIFVRYFLCCFIFSIEIVIFPIKMFNIKI